MHGMFHWTIFQKARQVDLPCNVILRFNANSWENEEKKLHSAYNKKRFFLPNHCPEELRIMIKVEVQEIAEQCYLCTLGYTLSDICYGPKASLFCHSLKYEARMSKSVSWCLITDVNLCPLHQSQSVHLLRCRMWCMWPS